MDEILVDRELKKPNVSSIIVESLSLEKYSVNYLKEYQKMP